MFLVVFMLETILLGISSVTGAGSYCNFFLDWEYWPTPLDFCLNGTYNSTDYNNTSFIYTCTEDGAVSEQRYNEQGCAGDVVFNISHPGQFFSTCEMNDTVLEQYCDDWDVYTTTWYV